MKKFLLFLKPLAPLIEIILSPLTLAAVVWFRVARYWGLKELPLMRFLFLRFGMYPVVDHYYDPLFDYRKVPERKPHHRFDFNVAGQLNFLSGFSYQGELRALPLKRTKDDALHYYYENGSFGPGDAEFYYSLIRLVKPSKIIEVGSGFSTLAALAATKKNSAEKPGCPCEITCVEPYEMPWLERTAVNVLRTRVEELPAEYFDSLGNGDILFVDSSHIIRPGGDVVTLIMDVLPRLQSGVFIHFHDIFTPEDYPVSWLRDHFRMWNEQYLLEAFLMHNQEFEIVGMMSFLKKNHFEKLSSVFPVLGSQPDCQPGSLWLRKR